MEKEAFYPSAIERVSLCSFALVLAGGLISLAGILVLAVLTIRLIAKTQSPTLITLGETFHKVSGGGNAFAWFRHLDGELARSGEVLRGENGAQISDQ